MSRPDISPVSADADEAPELTDAWFDQADFKIGDRIVRRGRPPGAAKQPIAIRLDRDVVDHFKAGGAGWQSRMNAVLRQWVRTHPIDGAEG